MNDSATGDAGGTTGDPVRAADDAGQAKDAASQVTHAVGRATGAVDEVTDAVDDVTDAVDTATGAVDDVTGAVDPATAAVDDVTGAVGQSAVGAGDGTRAVRAGLPEPVKHEPTLPGPVFAAHFHLPGDPTGPYTYGRDENPTWTLLERAVGELEAPGQDGAETLVFASGMAAISAVLFSQLRTGDVCVLPDDGYQALPLVRAQLEAYGIEVRTAPTGGDAQLDVLDGARLLWIETPSNPGLDVCDIRRLAEAAHARGALVAVDNTLATPLGQRPLELGADFAVASGTKQLTGHGDVLLGYVVGRNAGTMAAVRRWRKIVGAIPGPMEAWLAHRSIATLQMRVDRQSATALTVAEALRERPEVAGLRYPGLPDDPSHEIAARQMRRFGCVVSFTLPTRERADRFLDALRLVDDATSFGGVRSTAERRGRWGGDAVPEGFIRLSVGAEDPEDLVADVLGALEASGA
ncbi:cystathionine gamma-lyase [Streptomyces luteogriseus]|uniref:cystathionine gamma-lyase n=1 Tax=Streptomyces luteogriseus TaxID=68233 RepID=UPI0033FF69C9